MERRETARGEEPAAVPQGSAHDASGGPHTEETPPAAVAPGSAHGASAGPHTEEMPRVAVPRRRAIAFAVFMLSAVAFLYFVLPKLAGVGATLHRLERGDKWWIGVGVALEVCSFAGYVVLFRTVFARPPGRIDWRASYQITMAGLAATRLFATAGAGGIALTAWAVRRSGLEGRMVACRIVAFLAILYAIFLAALVIDGIGLSIGLFAGGGSFAITLLPAILAAMLLAVTGAVTLLPGDIERRMARVAGRSGRLAPLLGRAGAVPALAASGVRTAIRLVRSRRPGLLGAVAWWGFDISVLWAMFHAFGSPPPFAVIVMAYFLGMLGNLLPLPGGLGGVEGGMIGAFAAFGVNFNLSVLAVLSYRAIAFWLPTLPGTVAYFQLRHTVSRWRGEQARRPAPARGDSLEAPGPLPAR
jgi:uncharacterized membrane protein YbhN (UPF0104 family)